MNGVVGVLALDQHVRPADRPGVVVPVLPVEVRKCLAVVLAQVVLGDREHAARPARGVVDRLDLVARAEVRLGREQEADHQPDHLARREVLPGLLVRLLGADADELLEHVPHRHVVDALRREVDVRELLDDLVEQVPLVHARDVLVEPEALHDLEDVVREVPNVAAEVLRDVVRVVEQPREVEPRGVVERPPRGALELLATDVRAVAGVRSVGGEHRLLRLGEHAVEAPEHGEGEDDLAVLVALVGAAQQVADAPDEGRQLGMRPGVHALLASVIRRLEEYPRPRARSSRLRPYGRASPRGSGLGGVATLGTAPATAYSTISPYAPS